jgi:hypothetical protein
VEKKLIEKEQAAKIINLIKEKKLKLRNELKKQGRKISENNKGFAKMMADFYKSFTSLIRQAARQKVEDEKFISSGLESFKSILIASLVFQKNEFTLQIMVDAKEVADAAQKIVDGEKPKIQEVTINKEKADELIKRTNKDINDIKKAMGKGNLNENEKMFAQKTILHFREFAKIVKFGVKYGPDGEKTKVAMDKSLSHVVESKPFFQSTVFCYKIIAETLALGEMLQGITS